jgi:hypothetical protein
MLARLSTLYHPERFHYHHRLERKGDVRFEGWYYKLVDRAGQHPYAFIPGVFLGADEHAFVQVLDGARRRAFYHRYPLSDFWASRHGFDVRVGKSRFHAQGMELDIDSITNSGQHSVRGEIQFGRSVPWPVTAFSPGCMGPLTFLPFMECYHGILSVDHRIHGSLVMNGEHHSFDAGRGYLEKDWGRSFPEGYVWMQSNHFESEGISLTASTAKVPFLGARLRGFFACFLFEGKLHRFATYTGARITHCAISDKHVGLEIQGLRHRLELFAHKATGSVLNAPYGGQMVGRVAETMQSSVDVRFSLRNGPKLFEGTGLHGCLEAVGKLEALAS